MTELGKVAWENYTHQNLWDMILPADPKEIMHRADQLNTLAADMDSAVEGVRDAMQKLMSAWSGNAADTANQAVTPALDWATQAATTASEIAHRLGAYADAIDKARADMPLPADFRQMDAHAAGAAPMPTGETGTAAGKQQAVHVMRRYEHASAQAYHGLPTFQHPPTVGHLPAPGPAPEPPATVTPTPPLPQPVPLPLPQPPTSHDGPLPDVGSASTSLSSFTGPVGPAGVIGGPGSGGLAAGLPGGSPVGPFGGVPAGAAVPGTAPVSGAGVLAAGPARLGPAGAMAEAAEEPGWGGFAPMGQGGRGDRDGEHRDKFAGRPDLVGDLPPAFPPVLGL
ncbi:MAG TPA: PPE domain-containing protein [Pseudonocardiaceae bacterium]|nr:PPE domain-containing protein [Pseudonocardiaceae bacterium]